MKSSSFFGGGGCDFAFFDFFFFFFNYQFESGGRETIRLVGEPPPLTSFVDF